MNFKYLFIMISFITVIMTSIVGCSTSETENNNDAELTIAAASDLTLSFTEVGELFEVETGSTITFSFGSTGQLADQIENGAPFDVFAAANIEFVDILREKDLIFPDSQTTYAFGRVGIATLLDSSLEIETLEDLLKQEVSRVAIANPAHAPYGLAAKQAFETAGLWEQAEDKLVYGRNISDTLNYIETGNVEAGIIALSLYNEDEVIFHIIDEDMHAPLEQSIAVTRQTSQEELSREFIKFIMGPVGKPIMESYGFMIPEVR